MLRLRVASREASLQSVFDAQVAEQVSLFRLVCGDGMQLEQPLVDPITTLDQVYGYSVGE